MYEENINTKTEPVCVMKLFICLLQIIIYYTNINVTFKSSNINDNDAHIWYKQDLINRNILMK